MHKLVLIRHGESTWNLENRFTGGGGGGGGGGADRGGPSEAANNG